MYLGDERDFIIPPKEVSPHVGIWHCPCSCMDRVVPRSDLSSITLWKVPSLVGLKYTGI